MRRFSGIFVIGVALAVGLSGCERPLTPSPRLSSPSRSVQSDEELTQKLRKEWEELKKVKMTEGERQELIRQYNTDVFLLLNRLRRDALRYGKKLPYEVVMDEQGGRHSVLLERLFDDLAPAKDIRMTDLKERYIVPGLGVPLVGIIPAGKLHDSDRIATFHAHGAVRTLTALVEFKPCGRQTRPLIRLIPRQDKERVQVGRLSYPLSADFSAAIEMYWRLTEVDKGRILGLLRPQPERAVAGLTCIERYDPDKIPVVLVHGLVSSAATFSNLVNRLQADPKIRHHYQFWYFNYPTGTAWTISAAAYRKALREARERFDPLETNENWERMVVVGHSMGGLITRYSQCTEPWKILEAARTSHNSLVDFFSGKYVNAPLPSNRLREMKEVYYFRPIKASQVVYMATPHRGTPFARNRFVLLLSNMVRLPQVVVEEAFSIATLQRDNLITNPRRLTEWYTSIRQLSPDSYSIRGLSSLSVRNVPTHSIIGDRGRNNSPHSSDGVVPYWSSHIPWGSECIVPSGHSVQDTKEAAEEMKRILLNCLHLPPLSSQRPSPRR